MLAILLHLIEIIIRTRRRTVDCSGGKFRQPEEQFGGWAGATSSFRDAQAGNHKCRLRSFVPSAPNIIVRIVKLYATDNLRLRILTMIDGVLLVAYRRSTCVPSKHRTAWLQTRNSRPNSSTKCKMRVAFLTTVSWLYCILLYENPFSALKFAADCQSQPGIRTFIGRGNSNLRCLDRQQWILSADYSRE